MTAFHFSGTLPCESSRVAASAAAHGCACPEPPCRPALDPWCCAQPPGPPLPCSSSAISMQHKSGMTARWTLCRIAAADMAFTCTFAVEGHCASALALAPSGHVQLFKSKKKVAVSSCVLAGGVCAPCFSAAPFSVKNWSIVQIGQGGNGGYDSFAIIANSAHSWVALQVQTAQVWEALEDLQYLEQHEQQSIKTKPESQLIASS